MRVITIYNKKGGTGKTSLTTNIAASLAAAGYNVAVVDGDEQANTSALCHPHKYSKPTLTHVVTEDVALIDAMYQARQRLWIVPADMNLSRAVEHISGQQDMEILVDRVEALQAALSSPPSNRGFPWKNEQEVRLREFSLTATTPAELTTPPEYLDFLFMDNPPNPNSLTTSMLFAATEVLIPMELEQFAYTGLAQMFDDIGRKFKRRQSKIKIAGIVPMRVDHRGALSVDYLKSVWSKFPALVAPTVIHTDKTIPNAQAYNQVAFEEDRNSRAARETFSLALWLAGWNGKIIGLDPCKNCEEIRAEVWKEKENSINA